jgi:hypothetical protein
MRVLVHTGMPKAGSSAIQAYLASNRAALAADGIDYPDYGHRGHWPLSAALVRKHENYHHARRKSRRMDVDEVVRDTKAQLIETLERQASRLLILSHEDLSVEATLGKLDALLTAHGCAPADVTYLAYLRHPVSMYGSAVQQALKSGSDRSYLPSTWINTNTQRAAISVSLLGERFVVRPFAPPSQDDWDVIEDFRDFCRSHEGVELPVNAGDKGINTSLSAEACAVLELARGRFDDADVSRSIRQAVRRFDSGWKGHKLTPPAEWLADVAAVNAKPWNTLLLRIGLDMKARQRLRIKLAQPTGHYHDDDIHRWLVAGLRSEWVAAFLDSGELSLPTQEDELAARHWLNELRIQAARAGEGTS